MGDDGTAPPAPAAAAPAGKEAAAAALGGQKAVGGSDRDEKPAAPAPGAALGGKQVSEASKAHNASDAGRPQQVPRPASSGSLSHQQAPSSKPAALTARNLVLKEKAERAGAEMRKRAASSRPQSVHRDGNDDEMRLLAGPLPQARLHGRCWLVCLGHEAARAPDISARCEWHLSAAARHACFCSNVHSLLQTTLPRVHMAHCYLAPVQRSKTTQSWTSQSTMTLSWSCKPQSWPHLLRRLRAPAPRARRRRRRRSCGKLPRAVTTRICAGQCRTAC